MAMTATQSKAKRGAQSALYLYGVTWAGQPGVGKTAGVAGSPVGVVEHRHLAAIVSCAPAGPIRTKRRDLLAHMDVLQRAFDAGTVLPVQFGSVFPERELVVSEVLRDRYDELIALLERFDGLAELRVRAAYSEDAILGEIVREDRTVSRLREVTRTAGVGDPRQVQLGEAVARALAARRDRDARSIATALAPHARDAVIEEPRTELELYRASYLVDRDAIGAFDAVMDGLARAERDRMSFTYTGPLPAHSFVSLPARRG